MGSEYKKIDPSSYMDEVGGEKYPDYMKIVGQPIKLGRDKTTQELFDDITKQLIDDGLVEISEYENKGFISFTDNSQGYAVSKVVEDNGEGVMVMINENGSLSPYEENSLDSQTFDEQDEDLDDVFDNDEEELN